MPGKNFHEVIKLIRQDDPRYESGAYAFMRQALDFTLAEIRESEESKAPRHISGQELCEGLRAYALKQYGPMAHTLLQHWGIRQTEDFGQIVFNLVEFGIFGKTETDSLDDFKEVYDFEEVFVKPFQPSKATLQQVKQSLSQSS